MFKQSRNKDLTQVVDDVWKANHNEDVKKAKQKEIEFIDKLFDVKKPPLNKTIPVTPAEQAQKLSQKINQATNFNRQIQNKRFK